jgi:sugar/nucleoside kinase (ribokinase family)
MKKYDAIIAGYLCMDMVPEFPDHELSTGISGLLKPGKLIEIGGLEFNLGGVVANTGLAMKKFGKKVYLNGLIGNDFIGEIAKNMLDKYGLAEGIKITGITGTAFGIVLAPPDVDRIFLESPGCSKIFDIDFIDFKAVSESRLFHFGYPPLLRQFYLNGGVQLKLMFSKVQEMGVATSLDFSLPDLQSESGKQNWLQIIRQVLPYTDIFVPSLEEVLQVMKPDEYARILSVSGNSEIIDLIPISIIRDIGQTIIDLGAKVLLIKAGHRGIYLLTGDVSPLNQKEGFNLSGANWNHRELWCDAYPVDAGKVKNATGAGDTAAAAFLSAILDGLLPETALKLAAIAGRNNLYCRNIYLEISEWQDMESELTSRQHEISDLNNK